MLFSSDVRKMNSSIADGLSTSFSKMSFTSARRHSVSRGGKRRMSLSSLRAASELSRSTSTAPNRLHRANRKPSEEIETIKRNIRSAMDSYEENIRKNDAIVSSTLGISEDGDINDMKSKLMTLSMNIQSFHKSQSELLQGLEGWLQTSTLDVKGTNDASYEIERIYEELSNLSNKLSQNKEKVSHVHFQSVDSIQMRLAKLQTDLAMKVDISEYNKRLQESERMENKILRQTDELVEARNQIQLMELKSSSFKEQAKKYVGEIRDHKVKDLEEKMQLKKHVNSVILESRSEVEDLGNRTLKSELENRSLLEDKKKDNEKITRLQILLKTVESNLETERCEHSALYNQTRRSLIQTEGEIKSNLGCRKLHTKSNLLTLKHIQELTTRLEAQEAFHKKEIEDMKSSFSKEKSKILSIHLTEKTRLERKRLMDLKHLKEEKNTEIGNLEVQIQQLIELKEDRDALLEIRKENERTLNEFKQKLQNQIDYLKDEHKMTVLKIENSHREEVEFLTRELSQVKSQLNSEMKAHIEMREHYAKFKKPEELLLQLDEEKALVNSLKLKLRNQSTVASELESAVKENTQLASDLKGNEIQLVELQAKLDAANSAKTFQSETDFPMVKKEELMSLKEELKEKEEEVKELNLDRAVFLRQISEKDSDIAKLKSDIEGLEVVTSDVGVQKMLSKDHFMEEKKKYEDQISVLEEENQRSRERINVLLQKKQKNEVETAEFEQRLREVENSRIIELEEELKDLRNEKQDETSTHKQLVQQRDQHFAELEEVNERNQEMELRLYSMEKQALESKKSVKLRDRKIIDLKNENNELHKRVDKLMSAFKPKKPSDTDPKKSTEDKEKLEENAEKLQHLSDTVLSLVNENSDIKHQADVKVARMRRKLTEEEHKLKKERDEIKEKEILLCKTLDQEREKSIKLEEEISALKMEMERSKTESHLEMMHLKEELEKRGQSNPSEERHSSDFNLDVSSEIVNLEDIKIPLPNKSRWKRLTKQIRELRTAVEADRTLKNKEVSMNFDKMAMGLRFKQTKECMKQEELVRPNLVLGTMADRERIAREKWERRKKEIIREQAGNLNKIFSIIQNIDDSLQEKNYSSKSAVNRGRGSTQVRRSHTIHKLNTSISIDGKLAIESSEGNMRNRKPSPMGKEGNIRYLSSFPPIHPRPHSRPYSSFSTRDGLEIFR